MEGLDEVASIVLLGSNYYSDVAEVLGYKGGLNRIEVPLYWNVPLMGWVGEYIGYIGVFRVLKGPLGYILNR